MSDLGSPEPCGYDRDPHFIRQLRIDGRNIQNAKELAIAIEDGGAGAAEVDMPSPKVL